MNSNWEIINLEDAHSWFNISLYGRLAKRLIKEAQNFTIDSSEKTYYGADIERYCAINNITLFGKIRETEQCHQYWVYLKVESIILKIHSIENYRHIYKFINSDYNQLALKF